MNDEKLKFAATPFDYLAVQRRRDEEMRFQDSLHPSDPRHKGMFALDLERSYLDLYWGGYEYSMELDRIDTRQKFLEFLSHILAKDWEHATARRVGRLICAVATYFKWDLWGSGPRPEPEPLPTIAPRTTSATEERSKLTPKLRYDVLLRDDFRCRACGFAVESGAHLHIDHVRPISGGGRTEFNNLQALCSVCNQGKGARR